MLTHSLTHTCSHTYPHSYSHIRTHTHTPLHALIHIYTHTLYYTHTHFHTHIFKHTHSYIHIPTLSHSLTHKHIYKYNLPRPFRVVHMYFEVHLLVFANLSGHSSQEKTDSFTLSNHPLPVVLLWGKPCEIFPVHGGMSIGDTNF